MKALRDWSLTVLVILGAAAVWPTIFVLLGLLAGGDANATCRDNRHEAEEWDGSDDLVEARSTLVPLSEVCRWDDGYTLDIVPGWVNPVVGAYVASFSLATAGAITGAVRSRPHRSDA
ncbi:hypothetical protein [Jiangella mangrovi]|uniref:Uncharacterized protein n=1 Tax=Jiangella mangrovi TaxID=1524084 RepID=A0A7W9LKV5_9ACTN|nr:hypothetical protein [Jiangella mangrovi]MBB5787543.1 hypothetical protein [Jiangella mangrovi]